MINQSAAQEKNLMSTFRVNQSELTSFQRGRFNEENFDYFSCSQDEKLGMVFAFFQTEKNVRFKFGLIRYLRRSIDHALRVLQNDKPECVDSFFYESDMYGVISYRYSERYKLAMQYAQYANKSNVFYSAFASFLQLRLLQLQHQLKELDYKATNTSSLYGFFEVSLKKFNLSLSDEFKEIINKSIVDEEWRDNIAFGAININYPEFSPEISNNETPKATPEKTYKFKVDGFSSAPDRDLAITTLSKIIDRANITPPCFIQDEIVDYPYTSTLLCYSEFTELADNLKGHKKISFNKCAKYSSASVGIEFHPSTSNSETVIIIS